MKISSGALISACGVAVVALAVAQQPAKPQFTARELFYAASQPAKTPPPGPAKPAEVAQTATATRAPKRPPTESASVKNATKATDTAALPKMSDLQPQSSDKPTGGLPAVSSATSISMAPAPSNGTPLGLRYTILKKSGSEMVEVAPGTVFHTGDAIQFSVQANGPGYLYIVTQGSTGMWKPLFPAPEIADGNNYVDGWRPYTMPPGSRYVFDENKGTEKIFIVFSREPEQDLEKTIYMLRNGVPKPAAGGAAKQMIASNEVTIDNKTVGNLRNVYARDLIIEKVSPATPGERKETAIYVVNPTGNASSRVVADLQLVHE